VKEAPVLIIEAAALGKSEGSFSGAVLMADICGYTSRFRGMADKGARGAEELSDEVSSTLSSVVEVCARYGGFPVSFAGDAVTVLFPGGLAAAETACRDLSSSFPSHFLPLRASVGFGRVNWDLIPMDGFEFYSFQGPALSLAAGACANNYFCEASAAPESAEPFKTATPNSAAEVSPACVFLPPMLFNERTRNEFRHVVSVFISIENRMDESCSRDFQELVLHSALENGGFVSSLEAGAHGYRMLVVFGAPLSRVDDPACADAFLAGVFAGASGRVRAGVSAGLVFSGRIVTPLLEAYTVLGPSVNLAARLHDSAGWNKVLADPVFNRESMLLDLGVTLLQLKGFTAPVASHELSPWKKRIERSFSLPPLLQREDVVNDLIARLGKFDSDIVLSGEPGMGKTRIMEEITSGMPNVFFIKLRGGGQPETAGADIFSKWFFGWFGVKGDSNGLPAFRDKLYGFIGCLEELNEPEAALAAAELLRAESVLAALVGLRWERSLYEGLDPVARYSNAISVIAAFVRGYTILEKTVIVIDDLHLIQPDSLHLLSGVLQELASNRPPLLLLSAGAETASIIETLGVTPVTLELLPLDRAGSESFLEWSLGLKPSSSLLDWFCQRTEGNPFFMEQYAAMLDSPSVPPSDERFPGSLYSVLVARLDKLEGRLKQAVLRASILGREFRSEILEALYAFEDLPALLDQGVHRRIWIQSKDGSYRFCHNPQREAAYRLQLHSERVCLHEKAAAAMALPENDVPEKAGFIAHHLEMAEKPASAAIWYMKAGEYSLSRRMNTSCLMQMEKVLLLSEDPELRMDAHKAIYELNVSSGEIDLAEAAISRASLEINLNPVLKAGVTLMRANLAVNKGLPDSAEEYLNGLEEMNPSLRPDIIHLRGRVLMLQGRTHEGMEHMLSVYEELKLGNAGERSIAHRALGNAAGCMLRLQSPLEEAEIALLKVLNYARENSNLMMETLCVGNLALVYKYMPCRADDARRMTRKHLELARKTGSRLVELQALGNLGSIIEGESRSEEAFALFREAISLAEKYAGSDSLSIAHASMALALYRVKRYDEAVLHYRNALEICREKHLGLFRIDYTMELGTTYLAMGELSLAEEQYSALKELSIPPEYEVSFLVFEGKLLIHKGMLREAEQVLQSALGISVETRQKFDTLYELYWLTKNKDTLKQCIEQCEELLRTNPHWGYKEKLDLLKPGLE
jgi:class 3 adenylate cyclase/tetratricopeptide (TPR) repeat protein